MSFELLLMMSPPSEWAPIVEITMPMHRLARCVRHHACAVLRCRRNRKQRTSCVGGAIWLFLTTFLLRDLRYSIDRTVRITNHAEGETTMAKPALPADNLFSALPPELSRHLFDEARVQNVKADQVVFLSGDAGDGCYRIEEGLLKVSVITPGGAERILAILGPGSIVGELSMIDGSARSASVSALRDSKLSFISRAGFDAFGRSNPDMYQYLMVVLARRLRDTNSALAATSFLSVKGRVARSLLSLAEAFGHDVGGGRILVRQKVTQSDLGAMAGIARENVSRILKEWTTQAVVSRLAGYYCLEKKAVIEREAAL